MNHATNLDSLVIVWYKLMNNHIFLVGAAANVETVDAQSRAADG